jgi:hypothetical protein
MSTAIKLPFIVTGMPVNNSVHVSLSGVFKSGSADKLIVPEIRLEDKLLTMQSMAPSGLR